MFHSRSGLVFMNAELGQLSSLASGRTHTHTLLPAKAFLHRRKMKQCYLHSESTSGKFPLTTCYCQVLVL